MSTSDKEKGCKPTPTSNAGLTKHLESGTEHTLSTVVIENLDNMNPHDEFINNYGNLHTGKKLKKFIQEHFKDKIDVSANDYLRL